MRIKIGYYLDIYRRTGVLVNATIKVHGSTLIAGITGSGKTTLLWLLLHSLIKLSSESHPVSVQFCDWKQEHSILYGCSHYHYALDDIIDTIDTFYDNFQNTRGHSTKELHYLVIDEHMNFMNFLEQLSKTDKHYKEVYSRITMEISSILAMGRTLNHFVISIVQQANAKSFASTADRENFINRIAMGTLSSTASAMIFDAVDISDINFKKPMPVGCGYVSVQGDTTSVRELIVPNIKNMDEVKTRIRQFLDNPE